MLQPWMNPADLAPGDAKSAERNWSDYELHRLRSIDDPLFPAAFDPLWREFHASNEMEPPAILARRMEWNPATLTNGIALFYELLLITRNGEFVAVRDQTAIVRPEFGIAVVHLSHNLVARPHRRSGIAGWQRALPIQTARHCLAAQGLPTDRQIYLVGEMEPADPADEARSTRLIAYEKAGYRKVDPSVIRYLQPDFRAPAEIDASGGPQPLRLNLLVRKVGREEENVMRAETVRSIVHCLYEMYATQFRPSEMRPVWDNLETFPRGSAAVSLLSPTSAEPS